MSTEEDSWAAVVSSIQAHYGSRVAGFSIIALVDQGDVYDRWSWCGVSDAAIAQAEASPEHANLCLNLLVDTTRAAIEENAVKIGEMLADSDGNVLSEEDRGPGGLEFLGGALGNLLPVTLDYDATRAILARTEMPAEDVLAILGTKGVHRDAIARAGVKLGLPEPRAAKLADVIVAGLAAAAAEIHTVLHQRASEVTSDLVQASYEEHEDDGDEDDDDNDDGEGA